MKPDEIARRIYGEVRAANDPWAFTPDGLDWRWLPRKQACERLNGLAEELREPLSAAPAWSFVPEPTIATLLLDATLLSLGRSVRATAHAVDGSQSVTAEVDDEAAGRVTPGWRFARRESQGPSRLRLAPAGGGEGGQSCSGESWGPRPLDALWEALDRIPAGPIRDVVVTSADLTRLEERCAWLWALQRGASLVVCRAAEVPAAVGWARPTVLWLGEAAEERLERILSFCGGSSVRSKRRALRRLQQVVYVGDTAPSDLEELCERYGLTLRVLGA